MKTLRIRPAGVALLMALIVAALLVTLVGAFITVNRSNNAITGNVVTRQDAYNACLSGLNYVWAQLEQDQNWGAEGFPDGTSSLSYPLSSPKIRIRVHGDRANPEDLSLNYVEGELIGSGDKFEIHLINNLTSRALQRETSLGDIPGRTARLEIIGTSNMTSLRLQSVLRKSPYVDSSALSRDNLEVELLADNARAWKLRSKDPYVNQIRSNKSILGPSAVDGHLAFRDPPRGGVAMAKNDIKLGGVSVMNDPTLLENSQVAAKGSFQMGTPDVDVPDLERGNLSFPPVEVPIPEGEMQFKVLQRHLWTSKVFNQGASNEVTRWRRQVWLHDGIEHAENTWASETAELHSDSGELNSETDGFDEPTSSDGFQNVVNQPGELSDLPVLYENGEDHRMRANLVTGELAMTAGTTFTVDGTLDITQSDDGPDPQLHAKQPHLKFAYDLLDSGSLVFRGGENGTSAMDDPEANSAALTATGDLLIDGITTGFGSIFADQEVELRAKSGLRSDLDLAVAVHGESIRFRAEDPPENGGANNTHLEADFMAFKDALNPGYDSYEDYWNMPVTRRGLIGPDPNGVTGLRHKTLPHDARYYWNLLQEDLGLGDPPNFSSAPFGSEWTGNITLEEYIRLREYARNDSPAWLEMPGNNFNGMISAIDTNLSVYSSWAHRMDMPMRDYMQEEIALVSDVYFVGLVHAGQGGFYADANRSSMLIEGALVSQGALTIRNAPAVDFVYNRLYLDDVVRQFFGDTIKLDQVYYKIQ